MPPHRHLREWTARIEELCALIVRRPELTWLWEIRIKILMYLIRRYGDAEAPAPQPPAPPQPLPGRPPETRASRGRVACTADRRSQIRTLLERIHRVNLSSKGLSAR